jgi:hypothetical protein
MQTLAKEDESVTRKLPVLHRGEQGYYYLVDGFKYDANFPYEWALNHKSHPIYNGSGPKDCANCRRYGSILTVFVGYCSDCKTNIYNGERCGIYDATNTRISDFRMILPYMKNAKFANIGDQKGWTLRKERERREKEREEQMRKDTECEILQYRKRRDLLSRTKRKDPVFEEEWDDYWGSFQVTSADLFRWATSEY